MSTRRLFTAIRIPEPIGRDLGASVRAALTDARSFRVPRSDAFHLTLYFHGDVEAERVDALSLELDRALSGAGDCVLELGPTGAFLRRGAERVLWVAARAAEGVPLDTLYARALAGVEAAGFDTAEERARPFQPHVTVARPRGFGRRRPAAGDAFYALVARARFPVGEVVLLESISVPGAGHRYDTVRSFGLS